MATERQKNAARHNLVQARAVKAARRRGFHVPRRGDSMPTPDRDRLPGRAFAFVSQRKEPLTDSRHVRNAVSRFNQVEGVTAAQRDKAWKRITSAAKRFDVAVPEKSWRKLFSKGHKVKHPA